MASPVFYRFKDHYDHLWLKHAHETPRHLYQDKKAELINILHDNGEYDTSNSLNSSVQSSKNTAESGGSTSFLTLPNYGKVNFNNKQSVHDEQLVILDTCLKRLVELSVTAIQPTFIKEVKVINARLQKALLSNLPILPKSIIDALNNKSNTSESKLKSQMSQLALTSTVEDSATSFMQNSEMQIGQRVEREKSGMSNIPKEFNLYKGNRAVTFLATRMQSAMTISYFRSGNVEKMVLKCLKK